MEMTFYFYSSVKTIYQDECELKCLAKGHMFFLRLLPKVKDGTPCLTDLKKVCIDGKCKVRNKTATNFAYHKPDHDN